MCCRETHLRIRPGLFQRSLREAHLCRRWRSLLLLPRCDSVDAALAPRAPSRPRRECRESALDPRRPRLSRRAPTAHPTGGHLLWRQPDLQPRRERRVSKKSRCLPSARVPVTTMLPSSSMATGSWRWLLDGTRALRLYSLPFSQSSASWVSVKHVLPMTCSAALTALAPVQGGPPGPLRSVMVPRVNKNACVVASSARLAKPTMRPALS